MINLSTKSFYLNKRYHHHRIAILFQNEVRNSTHCMRMATSPLLNRLNKTYRCHDMSCSLRHRFSSSSIIKSNDRSPQSTIQLLQRLVTKLESESRIASVRSLENNKRRTAINDNAIDKIEEQSKQEIIIRMRESYMNMPKISMLDDDCINEFGTDTRGNFIEYIAQHCGADEKSINLAVQTYHNGAVNLENGNNSNTSSTDEEFQINLLKMTQRLRDACKPRYEDIFRLIDQTDRTLGMSFLLQLREDIRSKIHIMNLLRYSDSNEIDHKKESILQRIKQLDSDLENLLSLWFSAGTLEKIAKKEAVHPLRSLADLRTRLGPDRRCFAFFHPSLQDEPLVFVHVALLSNGIPESMDDLDCTNKNVLAKPTVATFYSITSTQPGLKGVDLGNFLIKRVVQALQAEYPSLQTFSTLSPIPRFRKWLQQKVNIPSDSKFAHDLFSSKEREQLQKILNSQSLEDVPKDFFCLLEDNTWYESQEVALALKPILLRLAAYYLTVETHRGKIIDNVARFHIKNGAEMYRLNYLADTSRKGIHNSSGIMINYVYNLDTIEKNQTNYELDKVIPICDGVAKWMG